MFYNLRISCFFSELLLTNTFELYPPGSKCEALREEVHSIPIYEVMISLSYFRKMGIYLDMVINEEEIHAGFKCLQIGDRKPKSYVGRFFQILL